MNILYHPAKTNSLHGGLLYNFHAIEDLRQVAPTGYRVATLADIYDLINYIGTEATAGGPLKAVTTWETPNTGATDSKGFHALPAGTRDNLGTFADQLLKTNIWIDNR